MKIPHNELFRKFLFGDETVLLEMCDRTDAGIITTVCI